MESRFPFLCHHRFIAFRTSLTRKFPVKNVISILNALTGKSPVKVGSGPLPQEAPKWVHFRCLTDTSKMIPKWYQNEYKMIPNWCQNVSKMMPKCIQKVVRARRVDTHTFFYLSELRLHMCSLSNGCSVATLHTYPPLHVSSEFST